MIDCGESDNMIEIGGKLDKSNTYLRFRCVIFRYFCSRTLLEKLGRTHK